MKEYQSLSHTRWDCKYHGRRQLSWQYGGQKSTPTSITWSS